MKSYKNVIIAVILFFLIVGGLRIFMSDERNVEAGVSVANKIQDKIDKAKAKQDEIMRWIRGHYLLNDQEETTAENSSEGGIRYSTGNDIEIPDVSGSTGPLTYYDTGYIFMGDSRIYLMNQDCHIDAAENFFVVACPGEGYDWMMSSGLSQVNNIRAVHSEIKNWVLVCGFGLNDIGRVDDYIATYENLAQTIDLRLLSVNPTLGTADPKYSNNNIEVFNSKIREISGTQYIDCYTYLTNKGYWMDDELHFNEDTNWDILAFVLDHLYYNSGMVTGEDSRERAQQLQQRLAQAS